jgi:hypothetical protein
MVVREFDLVARLYGEATAHRLVAAASAVYVALMAVPFVPGAEIGIGLIALVPPYLVGRLVPPRCCARAFGFLKLAKAKRLIERTAPLSAERRLAHLSDHVPTRFGPLLVRHKFLTLAVVLNLPGNILVGGGGGIALVAGMSGLFPLPAYLATIAIAVAPIPLLIGLTGLGT